MQRPFCGWLVHFEAPSLEVFNQLNQMPETRRPVLGKPVQL